MGPPILPTTDDTDITDFFAARERKEHRERISFVFCAFFRGFKNTEPQILANLRKWIGYQSARLKPIF